MVLFESLDALVSKIRYSLFMLSVRAFKSVINGPSVVLYLEYIDNRHTPPPHRSEIHKRIKYFIHPIPFF